MTEKPPQNEQKIPSYTIEPATPEDAERIARVQIDTWIDTYVNETEGITEEAIRKRFFGDNGELFQEKIERGKKRIANSQYGVYIARQGDKIAGFASPRYDEQAKQQRLGALYVLPEAQGEGLGKRLLDAAINALDRSQDIYLHVVTYNERAIHFYENNGFIKTGKDVTGSVDPLPNGVTIPEIEMKLPAFLAHILATSKISDN